MTEPRTTTTAEHEMERVISGILSSGTPTDPSACINALNPLINTAEGRRFLSKQEGKNALMLIESFDWALKSRGIPLNKGCILWTLRRLCACQETLPESCVLPIDFRSTESRHAAGGFADVWKGTHEGREVAFKSIRGSTLSDDTARSTRKRRFCKEVVLWKALSHPNILGLIGVCRWEDTPDARLTMVSDWMKNGNIMEYIKHNDAQRMILLVDCAKGVEYLHGKKLVHGDLKGANILITSDNPVRARLADFGFMTIVYDEADGPESTSALGGGTTPFMAPELLSPVMFGKVKCEVSKEADVYAFGMVILQVLSGLMPFHGQRDTEISYKVIQGDRPVMPANAREVGISDGLWQLLVKCWNTNYINRPQIDEILQHLSQEPELESIFPPSNIPRTPSCETIFVSATQKYADIFVTANTHTLSEEVQPFPMPASPSDTTEYSSRETRNVAAASLFSAETQDVSPFTSPEISQIRAGEPKPPASETPSWTISTRGDSSTIPADLVDDPATVEHAQRQGRVSTPLPRDPGPLQHDYDKNQHDPPIGDASHGGLALESVQGVPRSSSPQPDGKKPTLAKILTSTQLESRNSDNSGTSFYTPGGINEAVDRKPFDSAANIRIVYSDPSSHSRTAGGPARGVVNVHQPANKWKSEYQFPAQASPLPRSDLKISDDAPRHELRMPLARPSEITERERDSAFSFTSSPFDEFREDAGTSRRISEVNVSTAPRRESGTRPKSKLSARTGSEGNDIQGNNMFLRNKGKRMMPGWKGEGRNEEDHTEKGKGRDNHSLVSTPTDYVSVSGEVEEHSRNQNSKPSSNPSLIKKIWTKFRRVIPQTQDNAPAASITTIATATDAANTAVAGPSQERERAFSGLSFANLYPGLARGRRYQNKREAKSPIIAFFEDQMRPFT